MSNSLRLKFSSQIYFSLYLCRNTRLMHVIMIKYNNLTYYFTKFQNRLTEKGKYDIMRINDYST